MRRDSAALPGARSRLLVGAAIALALFWSVIAIYVVHGQMPKNVLELPGERWIRPVLPFITPEGWAFFTRSAREPRLLPFVLRSGEWRSVHAGPNSELRNSLGLDRTSRAQGVELALLLGSIPRLAWTTCEEAIRDCLRRSTEPIRLMNPSPRPTVCGDAAIAMQEPLPWAWRDARDEVVMPSRIVRIEVRC